MPNRIEWKRVGSICLVGGMLLLPGTPSFAGDTKVEVQLDQQIEIDFVDVTAEDSEAEIQIGGVVAAEGSDLNTKVNVHIEAKSVRMDGKRAPMQAVIGTVIGED